MKRRDDPLQAVKAYFDGLAAKDVSHIPWADNATLRTPLNPAGGERALLRARQAILYFFEGILPALGAVTVVRHYDGSPHRRKLHGKRKNLYVFDAFHAEKGEIIEQQNHYDSRPATG